MPRSKTAPQISTISSFVRFLLMTRRRRSLPVSGATAICWSPDSRVQKLIFNLVEPQAGDGNLIPHRAQAAEYLAYLRVVADRRGDQPDLVCARAPLFGLGEDVARGHDARRPVVETGPAEAAPLRAPARNLHEKALAHLCFGCPDD